MQKYILGFSSRTFKIASIILLSVVAILATGGLVSIRKLNTQYSMRQFMPTHHPLYESDNEIKKSFRLSDEEPMIVILKLKPEVKGTWLSGDRIAKVRLATEALGKIDGIQRVTSISNFETAVDSEKQINIGNLFSLVPQSEWAKQVRLNKLLSPGFISTDKRVVTIVGETGVLSAHKIDEVMKETNLRLKEIFPESEVTSLVSGVESIQAEIKSLVTKELRQFLFLAIIVCLLTLLAYFKSTSSVITCVLLIIVSNIGALAWMSIAKIPFSILSTSLPVLASIIALAISSHTLLVFAANWETAIKQAVRPRKSKIVIQTCKDLFFANFLTSLTTVIGFATMARSNVPLVRQFSFSVSVGILVSWVFITLALPPLMYLFPVPVARQWTAAKARWALWVIKFRKYILIGVTACLAAIWLNGTHLNWSVRFYDDLPDTGSMKEAASIIDQKLGGMIPLEVMIRNTKETDPWNDPARMEKIDALLKQWRKSPGIGSAIGLPDFLETGKGISVSQTRKSIAEILFLYSFSGAENPISQFLTTDGTSTRISLRLKDVPAEEMSGIIKRITNDAKNIFPDSEVVTGGMATLGHPLNEELSQQMIFGLWESLLGISLLMIVVLRSVRLAIIAALPNLLAPIALIATMSFMQTPVKPAIAIIFSIALGVAYNNTVYLMIKLKQLQKKFEYSTQLVERAWYSEGNPCLFSSVAILGGFAIFLSSYFSLNRTFGAYMLWSIGIGLLGDLFFLPVILKYFPSLLPKIRRVSKNEI